MVEPIRAIHTTETAEGTRNRQGLTLVHFPRQRQRFLWDRGYVEGLFQGYLGGVQEVLGGDIQYLRRQEWLRLS
jgi:hypothetical protein